MKTEQMEFWNSQFGVEYTERNLFDVASLDEDYIHSFGISRTEMNRLFLENLSIDQILEVGCNVGNQLRCLQHRGFSHLYGIELQSFAVEKSKELCKGINIIEGSAFDLPFKDGFFDLVYTSGVLIHIAPNDLKKIMHEIYRVSKKYIWGFEYFSEGMKEIEYRGNECRMWKGDYVSLFLNQFPDLKLVKKETYNYKDGSGNMDQMYLLKKEDAF